MAFVVQNDLSRFAEKLKRAKNLSSGLANKVAEKLAEKGEEFAKGEYRITPERESSVSVKKVVSKNKAQIIATGKQVAYLEFGTGVLGKGTYEGELPKDPITFTMKHNNVDVAVTVPGWTYNYRKDFLGWTPNDFRGRPAGMQMYNTMKKLREYIKSDLKDDLRGSDR